VNSAGSSFMVIEGPAQKAKSPLFMALRLGQLICGKEGWSAVYQRLRYHGRKLSSRRNKWCTTQARGRNH
jgi:hypothetical protein